MGLLESPRISRHCRSVSPQQHRNYSAFYFDEIPVSDDFCEKLGSFGFTTLDKVVMLHFGLVIVSHLAFYHYCVVAYNVQLACIVLDLSYLENIDLLAQKDNLLPYHHPLCLS